MSINNNQIQNEVNNNIKQSGQLEIRKIGQVIEFQQLFHLSDRISTDPPVNSMINQGDWITYRDEWIVNDHTTCEIMFANDKPGLTCNLGMVRDKILSLIAKVAFIKVLQLKEVNHIIDKVNNNSPEVTFRLNGRAKHRLNPNLVIIINKDLPNVGLNNFISDLKKLRDIM